MSLRVRLLLAISVVLMVTFTLFGMLEYRTLQRGLTAEVDSDILLWSHTVSHEFEQSWNARTGLDEPRLQERLHGHVQGRAILVQVAVSGSGTIYRSPAMGTLEFPAEPVSSGVSYRTMPTGDTSIRYVIIPILEGGRAVGWTLVGRSFRDVEDPLSRSIGLVVLSAGLTLAVAFGLVLLVLSRGLTPLTRVARKAGEIAASGDVTQRVAVPPGTDEVVSVASAFNVLVSRVEELLAREKQLLADTSHELRNPLTVICTDLDLLAQNISDEVRQEVVKEAAQEAERMRCLIQDLLVLARSDMAVPPPAEPVSLDIVVRDAVRVAADTRITLTTPEHVLVSGDQERLRQIVANLLQNAIRYARLTVRVELSVAHQEVFLTVEDDGPGIEPMHQPRVFDRFYQVDPARSRNESGAGLGLAIVQAHVQGLHGTVGVRSTPGQGATFEVCLPLLIESSSPAND